MAEADGETRTGSGFDLGRSPTTLDIDFAAEEAAAHATRLLGATQPASSRMTVVFEPSVTASILGIIGRTLSGEAVLKGRSLFADRLGEEVAAPGVTLVDDATDPSSFGAWPDDDEGLASRRNVLVEQGVLARFLHSSYSGRRSGAGSTGSAVRGYSSTPTVAPRALSLVPGTRSQEELIASVGEGVLVQSVTGLGSGVNAVSGDFSVGAEGLMIRNGALAEPVRGMTLASTLQRMCRDIVNVGADQRWFGGGAGMSLAVRDISIGGR
ncbi:MAG: TldE protein, part of TldE/TldD proteolytic complex [uncultured Acidimicrobiales bacterium]|uniref:TldE protein, part of TldE/TldD proteolytic complex n=1 Tax=uncultured Acidimicrobiales bacterium TaxID=310071 RepID=A0A6J4HBT7_9ACTN|nr:MAG: TldE protein, part of TldE/TldD proteolytic complex [uncultured Acidimicrobiales bacterium]